MWTIKLFNKSELTNGTFERELAKEFKDADGFTDYAEALDCYRIRRERIDEIINYLKTKAPHTPNFEIPF